MPTDMTRKKHNDGRSAHEPSAEFSWVPLYVQIHSALKLRIETGQYSIGALLPTEAELCSAFDASRFTVREALRRLADQGFIQRRPRAGTIVLTDKPQVTYSQSVNSIEDLFQIATQTHYVILSTTTVALDETTAERVGGETGENWIRVDGVRWDKPGGVPICFIQSYVPSRHAAIVAQFPTLHGPFYELLELQSGEVIEDVTQEIDALAMPLPIVTALGLLPGSLSLRLMRRYVTQRGTLIASFNWHRADRFTYRMQLHRRSDRSTVR